MKKVIRVFPRKTNATPTDKYVRVNCFPTMFDEADEVHVSVSFTYDMRKAEQLYNAWATVAPTKIGGPAFNKPSGEFIPGMYLKDGYTITSRGCPNNCWFCSVWKREPTLIELEIKDGWNILDDNLLACSDDHICKVFGMLKRQDHRPRFTGGLEAKILTKKYAKMILDSKPETAYFAYDTPDDYEHLINAGGIFKDLGYNRNSKFLCCYVLIGYPKDTFDIAEKRLRQAWEHGFLPMAMLYKNKKGDRPREWIKFARQWANHVITSVRLKEVS